MKYEIKRASRKELNIIIEWAAQEGWNPGLYDADSFFAADPTGYFLGFFNDRPISSISAVSYGGKFGFLGLYIVKPEFRGRGFGLSIWNEALKYLEGQNIGLDGVVAQQDNYKKSDFKLAYRNIRYSGKSSRKNGKRTGLINIKRIPLEKLIKYDSVFFPVQRSEFLIRFINQPESYGVVFEENKLINGYGLIRRCRNGYKIGPLFADNELIAAGIFGELQNFLTPKTQFFLDIPEVNKKAIKLAENSGMKPMFETARMYNKLFPKIDLKRIFGVTTFELG